DADVDKGVYTLSGYGQHEVKLWDHFTGIVGARHIANFFFGLPNLPEDLVPYWDMKAPGIPDIPRDASAAGKFRTALYWERGFELAFEGQRKYDLLR
ncbi:hypothetical protein PZH42_31165, partial [Bacteroides cellulosilyticus]|nr:hypothetical protein [Bacteroides cellulosilyticus]